jgi:hypothetical protein
VPGSPAGLRRPQRDRAYPVKIRPSVNGSSGRDNREAEGFTGRSEEQKVWLSAAPSARDAAPDPLAAARAPFLAFCPSDLPVKITCLALGAAGGGEVAAERERLADASGAFEGGVATRAGSGAGLVGDVQLDAVLDGAGGKRGVGAFAGGETAAVVDRHARVTRLAGLLAEWRRRRLVAV